MDDIINTSGYFTQDKVDKISKMTDAQMFELLHQLEGTDTWFAILRYTQQRLRMAESSILYADPVKEPTLISRNQGTMLGLSDLQNAVITLVMNAKQKASEEDK